MISYYWKLEISTKIKLTIKLIKIIYIKPIRYIRYEDIPIIDLETTVRTWYLNGVDFLLFSGFLIDDSQLSVGSMQNFGKP